MLLPGRWRNVFPDLFDRLFHVGRFTTADHHAGAVFCQSPSDSKSDSEIYKKKFITVEVAKCDHG